MVNEGRHHACLQLSSPCAVPFGWLSLFYRRRDHLVGHMLSLGLEDNNGIYQSLVINKGTGLSVFIRL